MTIRRRIALSFLAILLFFGVSQAMSLWSGRQRARSMDAYGRALTRQVIITSLRQDLDNLHKEVILLGEIQFNPGDVAADASGREAFHGKLDRVAKAIRDLKELTITERRPPVEELERTYITLADLWRRFYEYLDVEQSFAVAYAVRADPLSRKVLQELVPKLEQEVSARASEAAAEFERVQRLTATVTLAILMLTTGLAFWVAYRLIRHVNTGLSAVQREVALMGAGDLERRIPTRGDDEIAQLASGFNDMAARLLAARRELEVANRELAGVNRVLEARVEDQVAKLRLASRIQADLLPRSAPRIDGYDIAGGTTPAQLVGGDYYDFIPIDATRLAICLGDVSGKGLPASLVMANLQATIRGQTLLGAPPNICLERSNTLLFRSTGGNKYATVFYAILNVAAHVLSYSNGGHNPPLLFLDGSAPTSLSIGGTVVGLLDGVGFEEQSVAFPPGSLLVVYSDGIVEATNKLDQEFGEEHLLGVIERHRHLDAAGLLDAVVEAVRAHVGDAPQSDDMTMVVVKRT